jgi:hypothetical protein
MVSSWLQKIQTRQRKRKEKRKSLSVVLDVTAASSRPHDLDPTRQTREHPVRHRSAQARIRFHVEAGVCASVSEQNKRVDVSERGVWCHVPFLFCSMAKAKKMPSNSKPGTPFPTVPYNRFCSICRCKFTCEICSILHRFSLNLDGYIVRTFLKWFKRYKRNLWWNLTL